MTWIRITDWEELQHYKNRSPPWIKLHRAQILENRRYRELPDSAQALLIDLWLLGSENGGVIDYDLKDLEFRLHRASELLAANVEKLASAGFVTLSDDILAPSFWDASKPLADASNVLAQRRGEERRVEEKRGEEEGASPQQKTDARIPGWRAALGVSE